MADRAETKSNGTAPSWLITRREAASLLDIDESMLRVHEKAGRIPPAIIRASESDRRRRAFHLRADVIALQARLAHEALARRTEEQADRDFGETLADETKHTKLIELEDLAYDFEQRDALKVEVATQTEIEAELAARAAEETYKERIRDLEQKEKQRERDERRQRLEAESRNSLLLTGGLAAATLALGVWTARSTSTTAIAATGEAAHGELADKLRALMPDAGKPVEPEPVWKSVAEAYDFVKSLLSGAAIDASRAR